VAVIEDAHWADPLTLDMVRMLARGLDGTSVVPVVTYRDDEVAANPALAVLLGDLASNPRVSLAPLSDGAVVALADPKGLDGVRLARATGGNPVLVVESIAAGGRRAQVRAPAAGPPDGAPGAGTRRWRP
jgi:hypothetical protein